MEKIRTITITTVDGKTVTLDWQEFVRLLLRATPRQETVAEELANHLFAVVQGDPLPDKKG